MQILAVGEPDASFRRFFLFLVDATDGITPELAEAGGQPQISLKGAGFVNTGGTLVAIGNGSYYVILTAGEISTVGAIIVRYKSANTAEFQAPGTIIDYDWRHR